MYIPNWFTRLRVALHGMRIFICIGGVDVGADLSSSTQFSCKKELLQGHTFGPWKSNESDLQFMAYRCD